MEYNGMQWSAMECNGMQCCNAAMLQCCNVAMLQCCNAAMLQCCEVAMLRFAIFALPLAIFFVDVFCNVLTPVLSSFMYLFF